MKIQRHFETRGIPLATSAPGAAATKAKVARSAVATPPLPPAAGRKRAGEKRHDFILRMLRANDAQVAARSAEAAAVKNEKMAADPFALFRGSAALFFAYLADQGVERGPIVQCNGDLHPMQFGLIPTAGGDLSFGIVDPDETTRGPFSYDLKRCATGFALLARQLGKDDEKAVRAYVEGYVETLARDHPQREVAQAVKSYGPLRRLLDEAAHASSAGLLAHYVDGKTGLFKKQPSLGDAPGMRARMAAALPDLLATLPKAGRAELEGLEVAAVVVNKSKGIGSQGRERWFVLLADPKGAPRRILEIKEELPSIMAPYVALSATSLRAEGERVIEGYRAENKGGDPTYGWLTVAGKSCIAHALSPAALRLEPEQLEGHSLRDYARLCGAVTAAAHARTDEKSAARLTRAIDAKSLTKEVVHFSAKAADLFEEAWRMFKELKERGELHV